MASGGDRLELLRGTLDLLILRTLAAGPLHGYSIARAIQETTDQVLNVEEGSLYPSLHRMERRGWIAAEWSHTAAGRRARFYALTAEGRARLELELDRWRKFSRAVEQVIQPV